MPAVQLQPHELYDALRVAGIEESVARRATTWVTLVSQLRRMDQRLTSIESSVRHLQWMMAANLVLMLLNIVLLFMMQWQLAS